MILNIEYDIPKLGFVRIDKSLISCCDGGDLESAGTWLPTMTRDVQFNFDDVEKLKLAKKSIKDHLDLQDINLSMTVQD